MPSKGKIEERVARAIVQQALGVAVSSHDDNSRPSMVDLLIHLTPETQGALEVVSDQDAEFLSSLRALGKYGDTLEVAGLRHGWSVVLRHSSHVKRARKEVPGLLRALEQSDHRDLRICSSELSNRAARIGVSMARVISTFDPAKARLSLEGWTGWASCPSSLSDWSSLVLSRNPDVEKKLASHSGATERHAFIWATIGSDYGVQTCLENRVDDPDISDQAPPRLPYGISHLWIAGSMSTQGAVAWSEERGWWRTPWRFPAVIDEF